MTAVARPGGRAWGGTLTLLVVGLGLATGGRPLEAAPLTEVGRRAYEAARTADEAATAAFDEGEKIAGRLASLAPERDQVSEVLKPFVSEGEAARQALASYRRLAQISATDALRLLAEVAKIPVSPTPDPIRRDTLEQHATLAAHEAAVMAARARTEAERLRAIMAEARLATGDTKGGAGRSAGGGAGSRGATASPAEPRVGDTVVPNVIGTRLDAAVADLAAAGLKLGAVTGPREGHVVKQSPEGGMTVSRQSAVSLTLSATAATIAPSQ